MAPDLHGQGLFRRHIAHGRGGVQHQLRQQLGAQCERERSIPGVALLGQDLVGRPPLLGIGVHPGTDSHRREAVVGVVVADGEPVVAVQVHGSSRRTQETRRRAGVPRRLARRGSPRGVRRVPVELPVPHQAVV